MARPNKKTTSEKIEDQIKKIKEAESFLAKLNEELRELYAIKDKEDMELLLMKMKESNLTIDKALELLQTNNSK